LGRSEVVVAHQGPVALVSIELDCEAAYVALGIGWAALAGDGGDTQQRGVFTPFWKTFAFVYPLMSCVPFPFGFS
jgi:hypothetical protein